MAYGISGNAETDCRVYIYNSATGKLLYTIDMLSGNFSKSINVSQSTINITAEPVDGSTGGIVFTNIVTGSL